ncbi:MAG TPA: hypothetical protein VLH77_01800 [Gammaproteobacteria bacterium]|nr:hypothetical protein [Gammaproteobacteria bacterium]
MPGSENPPLTDSALVDLEESKENSIKTALQAELRDIRTLLRSQVLTLTHSDSGRILASKLYDCLEYLDENDLYYAEEHEKLIKQLEQLQDLKNKLSRIVWIASLQGLDEVESEFKDEIINLNEEIHEYVRKRKRENKHLRVLSEVNRWSRFIYYGTITAKYTTKGLQTLFNFLPGLLKNLGRLFPPLIISLDTIKNLFDLIFSVAARGHLSKVEKKMKDVPIASSPYYNKGFFLRAFGNVAALTLNVFIILIFTGVLATTPLGWALSVGVIASEWLSNTFIPAWQAWKNCDNLEKEFLKLTLKAAKNEGEAFGPNSENKNLAQLPTKIKLARKVFEAKQKDAIFGVFSFVGSILLAFAIITPPLYIPALILLIIPAVRTTVLFLNKYLDKKFGPPPPTPEHLALMPKLDSFSVEQIKVALMSHDKNFTPLPKTSPPVFSEEDDLLNLSEEDHSLKNGISPIPSPSSSQRSDAEEEKDSLIPSSRRSPCCFSR